MAIGGIKIAFLPNPERVEWVKPLQGWASPHWIAPHFLGAMQYLIPSELFKKIKF